MNTDSIMVLVLPAVCSYQITGRPTWQRHFTNMGGMMIM